MKTPAKSTISIQVTVPDTDLDLDWFSDDLPDSVTDENITATDVIAAMKSRSRTAEQAMEDFYFSSDAQIRVEVYRAGTEPSTAVWDDSKA